MHNQVLVFELGLGAWQCDALSSLHPSKPEPPIPNDKKIISTQESCIDFIPAAFRLF